MQEGFITTKSKPITYGKKINKQVKSSQVFGGNKIGTNSEYAPNSSFFLEMQLILLTNEY